MFPKDVSYTELSQNWLGKRTKTSYGLHYRELESYLLVACEFDRHCPCQTTLNVRHSWCDVDSSVVKSVFISFWFLWADGKLKHIYVHSSLTRWYNRKSKCHLEANLFRSHSKKIIANNLPVSVVGHPWSTQLFKTNPCVVLSNVTYIGRPSEQHSLTTHILPHAIVMYIRTSMWIRKKNVHAKYFHNCEKVLLSQRCYILVGYINTVNKKIRNGTYV